MLTLVFTILFWVASSLLVYAYFGYPLILTLLTIRRGKARNNREFTPHVSLIITAHNEEKAIREKLNNTLCLDYPMAKLEIIVASDASTDKTNDIVKEFAPRGVVLCALKTRAGKTAAQKEAVQVARGDIIVFSDATTMYKTDAIRHLARNFHDQKIGVVGGVLKYIDANDSTLGSGESLYWKYEMMLRRKESLLGALPAVSGAICAVRRCLYAVFPNELAEDFMIPLMVQKLGYSAVLEPNAVCSDKTVGSIEEEFRKRKRIAVQNLAGLVYMRCLLNPFKYGLLSLILFSHKVMRQLVPFCLLTSFATLCFLLNRSGLYLAVFVVQAIFYLLAMSGYIMSRRGLSRGFGFFRMPLYFCTANLGILFGAVEFLRGERRTSWATTRTL